MFASLLVAIALSAVPAADEADDAVPAGFSEPVAAPPVAGPYGPFQLAPALAPQAPSPMMGSFGHAAGPDYAGGTGTTPPGGVSYGDECDSACFAGGRYRRPWLLFHSTCDMMPHNPYFPEYFGYFYFRPYNYNHIFLHQNIIAGWKGDPRNPYSHEMFRNLYAALPVDPPGPPDPLRGRLRGEKRLPDLLKLLDKKTDEEPMPLAIPPAPQN